MRALVSTLAILSKSIDKEYNDCERLIFLSERFSDQGCLSGNMHLQRDYYPDGHVYCHQFGDVNMYESYTNGKYMIYGWLLFKLSGYSGSGLAAYYAYPGGYEYIFIGNYRSYQYYRYTFSEDGTDASPEIHQIEVNVTSGREWLWKKFGVAWDSIFGDSGEIIASRQETISFASQAMSYARSKADTVHYVQNPPWGTNFIEWSQLKIAYDFDRFPDEETWVQQASVMGEPYSRRVLAACDEAYVNACVSLPHSFQNSVQNILEIADIVKSLISGKGLLATSLKEAWLAYRYSYSTTKSDVLEYIDITSRICELSRDATVTSYGASSYLEGYAVRSSIRVNATEVIPQDTADFMLTYGLKISAYDVWDSLPYSFIVDWFLHVGDLLESLEHEKFAAELLVTESWSSIERSDNRFYLRFPHKFQYMAPVTNFGSSSGKTWLFRVTDAICMFL